MYHPLMSGMFGFGPMNAVGASFALFAIAILVWELFWKGLALWHAARNGQWIWFIVFLLVHTLGILEIVYLIWFRDDKDTIPLFPFGLPARSNAPVTIIEETVIIETSSDDSSAA